MVKTTGKEDPVELDFSYFVKEVVWRRIKGSCNKNEIPLQKSSLNYVYFFISRGKKISESLAGAVKL